MSIASIESDFRTLTTAPPSTELVGLSLELRTWLGVDFVIYDADDQRLLYAEDPASNIGSECEGLLSTVAGGGEPLVIDDADCVLLVALPIDASESKRIVAVGAFVIRHVTDEEDLTAAERLLGMDRQAAIRWINDQPVCDETALLKLSAAVLAKLAADQKIRQLEQEVEQVSNNLASTYEEISLLYGVTQNLRLTSSDKELGQLALDWLLECVPAEGLAMVLPENGEKLNFSQIKSLTSGVCPIDSSELVGLIKFAEQQDARWPYIANQTVTESAAWPDVCVRQLILTPLCEGENIRGWLAAFNHIADEEFHSVEASLLTSIGAILGIHVGNHDLYNQQSQFMASVVRALTSAIDAKDPYTCGHSERVAQISVRLAQQLGCDNETVEMIYMAGLLHDIGKIGIEDSVLRKAGKLTEAEYEHIKLHPELGYKILVDLKQFSDVLPIVLHHHEQWDGGGYPHGLAGEDIPYLARVCAVADSFDAMTSDRPYRRGMPFEKVETIFRSGSGLQWDPQIVDAFFNAIEDIREIVQRGRDKQPFELQQWD